MNIQPDISKIFCHPDESSFYSYCLDVLVFKKCSSEDTVVEFGSGDGMPVINAIKRNSFKGMVVGSEVNSDSYNMATSNITTGFTIKIFTRPEGKDSTCRTSLTDNAVKIFILKSV